MLGNLAPSLLVAILLVGCASSPASPSPSLAPASPSPGPSADTSPETAPPSGTPAPSLSQSPAPSLSQSPAPSAATPAPSLPPSPASATLPVRGSARENSDHAVLTAPAPGGGLYLLIPSREGPAPVGELTPLELLLWREGPALLALLDSTGRLGPGWPVALASATSCEQLLSVDDGSIRVICTLQNPEGNMFSPIAAFAFDSTGRSLAGWPVDLLGFDFTGRVVGDVLTLLARIPLGDVIEEGQPTYDAGLVTVAADGTLTSGVRVPMGDCCGVSHDVWAVAPDGIAYGVSPLTTDPSPQEERVSWITAIGLNGVRAGWPVKIDDVSSAPAFGPGGRTAGTAGSLDQNTSRVFVLDREGKAVSSAPLPIATIGNFDQTGGCSTVTPQAPLVANDGAIFVYGELDTAVYALDPSLEVMPGWPYRPATPLVRPAPGFEYEHEMGFCPSPAVPAVGLDDTLYLPLKARAATVGGSIAAVLSDGSVRSGWPVELQRPGAEFWSVVVGSDGTVWAVAIQPESNTSSSATVLGIGADGTVLYSTTIIAP